MTSFRFRLPSSRTELVLSFVWPLTCWACAAGGGEGETTVTGTSRPGSGTTATPSTPVTGAAPSAPDGPLFNAADLEPTDECDGNLPVVYRDFSQTHPDFEMTFPGDGVRHQLIEPALGADGKPVFKSSVGCPAQRDTPTTACLDRNVDQVVITSADSFSQWYRDTPGMNVAFEKTLELTDAGGGLYKYNSTDFFPIGNDQGFGITPPGQGRNFLFTTEVHVTFEYVQGKTFTFQGDDDLWIFVNKRLALDLGGMHGSERGVIDFDQQAAELGIVAGRAYPMDIFHAERHTSASNFGIETNIACFTSSIVR